MGLTHHLLPWGGQPIKVPILSVREEGLARWFTFLNLLALKKRVYVAKGYETQPEGSERVHAVFTKNLL